MIPEYFKGILFTGPDKITIESQVRVCDSCKREFLWEWLAGDKVPTRVRCQDPSCNGWAKEKTK